jgi:hypothetical protein
LQHWAQKARAGWELLGKGTICTCRDRTLFGKWHATPTNKKLLLWTALQDNGDAAAALLAKKQRAVCRTDRQIDNCQQNILHAIIASSR